MVVTEHVYDQAETLTVQAHANIFKHESFAKIHQFKLYGVH